MVVIYQLLQKFLLNIFQFVVINHQIFYYVYHEVVVIHFLNNNLRLNYYKVFAFNRLVCNCLDSKIHH